MAEELKYVFGPVPSRRLGQSLGVSPIPDRTCNYSCVYCQLGRTLHMTNQRKMFVPVEALCKEFKKALEKNISFDVVTVVGEGEPTLYAGLGELIDGLKARTEKPVAVITNGALLYDRSVREELGKADIVLPSLDAVSEEMFRKINRPYGKLDYQAITDGLIQFSNEYKGQLYLEIMLLEGVNCGDADIKAFAQIVKKIHCDRIYVNTPVRPPAEDNVTAASHARVEAAAKCLGAISIDMLTTGSFASEISDPYEAIIHICQRHPMNQFEIKSFLESKNITNQAEFFKKLQNDPRMTALDYKGILTYRVTGGKQ